MHPRLLSAAAAALAASCACAPSLTPTRTVTLEGVASGAVRGVALDGDELVVVDDKGIARLDAGGGLLARHEEGEHGLAAADYKDVAVLDDGRFLLIEDFQGTVYDPAAETQTVRFCVLPGGTIDDTPTVQKNDALAVSGNSVVANPRFYDGDTLQSSTLRTYRLDDGTPENDVDVDVELDGLAIGIDGFYGVHAGELTVLDTAGARADTVALVDTEAAQGAAVDVAAREIYVLDGDGVVRVYDITGLAAGGAR